MRGEWIRKPSGSATVIFVHGILSSGETCWRNENGAFWPELLRDEPELAAIGIYVFTYQTGIFSGSYRLSDIVDTLREHMQLDDVSESDRLIFVCHSMGGIVVRKFIVEQAVDLISSKKDVELFLIASPSLGSAYADWLSPIAKMFGHAQADVLRFVRNNDWLKDLDKEFTNLKEDQKLKIRGRELVEDKFIFLRKHRILCRWILQNSSGLTERGESKSPSNRGARHSVLTQTKGARLIRTRRQSLAETRWSTKR
ncbi:alpha/beta fold hydrolase [Rhizobium leguminosarum bv. viciae]|nr:alpha/beta fold hydrolase [Rhizobium leguminosarum bv. viciae]